MGLEAQENKFKSKTEYISFSSTNIDELIKILQDTQKQNPGLEISGGRIGYSVKETKLESETRILKMIKYLEISKSYHLNELKEKETNIAKLQQELEELEELWKDK